MEKNCFSVCFLINLSYAYGFLCCLNSNNDLKKVQTLFFPTEYARVVIYQPKKGFGLPWHFSNPDLFWSDLGD